MSLARQAIDSVHDIADEVVLVETTDDGQSGCIQAHSMIRIGTAMRHRERRMSSTSTGSAPQIARYPWILVLHQNECVTPFLAKELQQRIADTNGERCLSNSSSKQQYFGRTDRTSPVSDRSASTVPSSRCSFQQASGDMKISAAPGRVGKLRGLDSMRANVRRSQNFVERLNDSTTRAASTACAAAERPIMAGPLAGRVASLCRRVTADAGIRSGWTGLQIAVLEELLSHWVEEAKLYQLPANFVIRESGRTFAGDRRS